MSEIRELAMRLLESTDKGEAEYMARDGMCVLDSADLDSIVLSAIRKGMMRSAEFIDARAETIRAEGNITADTMARIYEAEAASIRSEADKLEGK